MSTAVVMPQVKGGKLVRLAVTTPCHLPIASELPTMGEAGVAGFEATFGNILLAPKGTPPAVPSTLNETMSAELSKPEVGTKLVAGGVEFVANTPEKAAARMRREADKWARVAERLELKVD